MDNFIPISTLLITFFFAGCSSGQHTDNPKNWSDDKITEWFNQKDWLEHNELQPDLSIDTREFAIRYHQHKDRWDIAFSFLHEADLSSIEAGTHELNGRDVFVLVSEYDSKNPEDVPYEAHENYADIHYVVSGIEYIGRSDLSVAVPVTSYDDERDIRFYSVNEHQHLLAGPERFFIFFPGELHSPGVKVEESIPVKKIVIKVKI